MKKIYNTILAIAVLLAFAPFSSAQDVPFPADNTIKFSSSEWNKPYEIDNQSKVAYRKIISKPNSQGIYHIMLDAFTTGSEVKLNKAVRADIVLVLDVSGSMGENMGSQTKLQALKNAVNTFIDLIDANDTDNAPTAGGRLGNRIAIVPYSSSVLTSGDNQERGFNTLNNASTMKRQINNLKADGGTNAHLGMQRALELLQNSTAQIRTAVLFTDGDPGYFGLWQGSRQSGWSTINAWDQINNSSYQNYNGERYYQNTLSSANKTINYASQIKALSHEDEDPTKQIIANVFTVSVIENASQFTQVYLGKTSSNWKSDATSMGNYTISTSGNHAISGWNTTDIWANGNGTRNTYTTEDGDVVNETKYAIYASNAAELENAFSTIASSSGGTSENLGESSVATVDVVSASFTLPNGADDSSIKVYTAKCEGMSGTQPVFGDLILAPNRTDKYQPMKKNSAGDLVPDGDPKDVDDLIPTNTHLGYSTSEKEAAGIKDKITVNGFDYTNNWCGEVLDNGVHVDWHGYKVTILIPIKMNPEALGGVGVETNGEGSGIWIDGENKFPFTSPQVNLPVNIIINKQGLAEGESSKFTILRKTASESTWEPVTSVFVTRHKNQGENAPRTRIEGLPATNESGVEYIYMVREDDWSWSYTLTSDKELTTEDNDNPFTFTNQKKNKIDTKIRHAESKATNTFKTGGGEAYDDSKNNNRTVITVE